MFWDPKMFRNNRVNANPSFEPHFHGDKTKKNMKFKLVNCDLVNL